MEFINTNSPYSITKVNEYWTTLYFFEMGTFEIVYDLPMTNAGLANLIKNPDIAYSYFSIDTSRRLTGHLYALGKNKIKTFREFFENDTKRFTK